MPIPLGILAVAGAGAGGGGAAFDLLETQILTSSASSVTFTGLDTLAAGYQHLQIRMVTKTIVDSSTDLFYLRFNSDSGNNYAGHSLFNNGSNVASSPYTAQSGIFIDTLGSSAFAGSNSFQAHVLDILNFSSSTKNTTVRGLAGRLVEGGTAFAKIELLSGLWLNTNAVTSFSLTPLNDSLKTGSRISIYGVKG